MEIGAYEIEISLLDEIVSQFNRGFPIKAAEGEHIQLKQTASVFHFFIPVLFCPEIQISFRVRYHWLVAFDLQFEQYGL